MKNVKNVSNNFWNKTTVIIGIIGIVVSIFFGVLSNRKNTTSLNIEKFNETLLTKPLNIDGLTISYIFHDSIYVTNLWQSTFIIKKHRK